MAQAYQSRCCFWRSSSVPEFSTLLRLKQGQVSKLIFENDAIRNRISDFDKRRISQPKIQ